MASLPANLRDYLAFCGYAEDTYALIQETDWLAMEEFTGKKPLPVWRTLLRRFVQAAKSALPVPEEPCPIANNSRILHASPVLESADVPVPVSLLPDVDNPVSFVASSDSEEDVSLAELARIELKPLCAPILNENSVNVNPARSTKKRKHQGLEKFESRSGAMVLPESNKKRKKLKLHPSSAYAKDLDTTLPSFVKPTQSADPPMPRDAIRSPENTIHCTTSFADLDPCSTPKRSLENVEKSNEEVRSLKKRKKKKRKKSTGDTLVNAQHVSADHVTPLKNMPSSLDALLLQDSIALLESAELPKKTKSSLLQRLERKELKKITIHKENSAVENTFASDQETIHASPTTSSESIQQPILKTSLHIDQKYLLEHSQCPSAMEAETITTTSVDGMFQVDGQTDGKTLSNKVPTVTIESRPSPSKSPISLRRHKEEQDYSSPRM